MGLANKSGVLYESIKVGKRWYFRAVDEDASHFSNGPFYVSWYDGKKKQMEHAGREPEHALRMAHLKRSALAFVAAGGEIKPADKKKDLKSALVEAGGEVKQIDNEKKVGSALVDGGEIKQQDDRPVGNNKKKQVSKAVEEYQADCKDRQGKSGYGLAVRTPKTYEDRICYLTEFKPDACMDEINEEFIRGFRRFLRNH